MFFQVLCPELSIFLVALKLLHPGLMFVPFRWHLDCHLLIKCLNYTQPPTFDNDQVDEALLTLQQVGKVQPLDCVVLSL